MREHRRMSEGEADARWYAAQVRVVCLVEGAEVGEPVLQDESVHIFRAASRESGFQRALELGRGQETEYCNSDGQVVRWRLAQVLTLDEIAAVDLDGAEVHSRLSWYEDGSPPFETLFVPELQEPDSSGI
jgi:hypothetical protein